MATDIKAENTPVVYHKLPPLPYDEEALAPHISKLMIQFHYGKHHKAYVDNLNALAQKDEALRIEVNELIRILPPGKPFNQAAQIWNHSFYWMSMSPRGGKEPDGMLKKFILKSFDTFENFKQLFTAEASGHFGSGWAWLVYDETEKTEKKLKIISTHDAGNPLSKHANQGIPLLACDIWEHAYYIDFKNSRADYIKAWWNLVNWEFANDNLSRIDSARELAKTMK